GEEVRLLVQIRGKGTRLLAEKVVGQSLSLVGPLGNGFPVVEREIVFVAGGVGIAPFAWLMRLFPSATLLVGFRSREMVPPLDWFDEKRLIIATDDGSVGYRGTVLDIMQKFSLTDKVVFACGPHRMLAVLSDFFERNIPDIEAYFSTESMMACGFGACKGCVLPKRDGEYALCCSDGPIFGWREMVWESR
ncbi:MAG: dihydroorotate dehydrogenase electron transfer subunit, partial [Brevinematales bacterium]